MCDMTAEIDSTIGSVRQIFTTDTVGEKLLIGLDGPTGRRDTPSSRREGDGHREANRTGCVGRG